MATATLDGKKIQGAVAWRLSSGVVPSQADIELDHKDADALMFGLPSPVTLKIESPGAKGIEIKFLYVVEKIPASNPYTAFVRVVDRRYWWPYKHVNHSFNVRRIAGPRRVQAGFNQIVLDPLVPRLRYASWSIPKSGVWTAKTALKEIWKTVQEAEKDAGGVTPSLEIDKDIGKLTGATLPLENIELQDTGDVALKRMLDFIPGAAITVDADGTVRVYSKASGAERSIMDELLPEQEDGGHATLLNYSRIRPSEVRIFFAPEVEMRFDFTESGDDVRTGEPGADSRPTLDNVLPIPDFKLKSNAQGTWIPFPNALRDWGAIPRFGSINYKIIREALVPFMDLWAGASLAGILDDKALWSARIAAIETHFRRTYRINPSFNNRIRQYKAYRFATVDRTTGTRAPAAAYQDWAVVATQRYLSAKIGSGASALDYCLNVAGYPKGGAIVDDTVAAPIEVSLADHDQGIIHLEFKAGIYRVNEQFLPSQVDNVPQGNLSAGGAIAWNSSETGGGVPALRANHKAIVVMTIVPGAPNSKKRLFEMRRGPNDAKKILPASLQGGLGEAHGPPLDVFIGPGWETARIAWVDADGDEIKRALGLIGSDEGDVSSLARHVTNLNSQKSLGETSASLDAIANAVTAAIYAGYSDRMGGERTNPVTHAVSVKGFIESVLHQVLPDGEASSVVTVGPRQPDLLDPLAFMPASTRAVILRLTRQQA